MTIRADEFFGKDLKVYNTKMTEIIIQQTKEDIAILQEKLEKLEELQRTKSPAEEAYKRVYGCYPPTTPSVSNSEDERWSAFQKGYNASKEECSEWKNVALLFGEELVSISPCGYYDMTAEEWVKWAKGAYEKNSDDLLKLVREKQRKCEALVDKLQDKNPKPPFEPTPQEPAKNKVPLYTRFTDRGAYGQIYFDDALRAVRSFLVDEAVIENENHEYITFTLQKSLLEFTND